MSEQDKRPYADKDNRIPKLGIYGKERKKFEVLYQSWTPYFRPGNWLQFIWRW